MAVDMFLKLDGIQGESLDHKHKGEIELLSFSWGVSNAQAVGGSGQSSGKRTSSDFSIVKVMDSASPQIMEKCCGGEHIQQGLIVFRKAGEKPIEYLKIKLTDILVSSYQAGGSNNGGVVPMDQVALSFGNVEIQAADNTGKFVTVNCDFKKTDFDTIGGLKHHHE